ncbi:hypothetical protein HR059_17470 [Sinorhizobium meliloti WSM1022]|jgi:hypothetical protein|uniref:hypothetical protein n=1 Tax=Rhizobium meliloti TaxID=382 RepID=UPI000485A7A9|nr:hypothetical protein [Sinorhizobium meliloti]ASQ05406.1 hypothetical protein CDO23_16575 [Sinorhizobium meliloti]MDW9829357.1 hypothetical protein [Sinorhizobium meliloti]MDW9840935.1 hypothetical protein [Sinorhizobium meliloti]MDX0009410.1 hypothetical protein [Sinorhizobium meliloti]MDX0064181.1 hypothetical protein [Sinorhizobium meliloti]
MAKLPALIEALSKYDPRGENAVENLTREMRRGGLISQGKRGLGAPDMTSTDVTNMLFAMATRQAKDAPEAVRKLRAGILNAKWTEEGQGRVDEFLDGLRDPLIGRGEGGFCRAGLFVDALFDELARHHSIAMPDNRPQPSFSLEILDPFTGTATVKVIFRAGWQDEVSLIFNVTDGNDPFGIQQSAIIPDEVVHSLGWLLRARQ